MVSKQLVLLFFVFLRTIFGETIKRNLNGGPEGLEFLHLGHFGPLLRLPNHPAFAHLGLTPKQVTGFTTILLDNGLLNPNALKLADGRPLVPDPLPIWTPPLGLNPNIFKPSIYSIDPYFLYILNNYAKFLPLGLGPQGIYGSTSLPKTNPSNLFKSHHQ